MAETAWLDATDAAGRSDVVEDHLERIRRLDPRLHAYIHVDEGARAGTSR